MTPQHVSDQLKPLEQRRLQILEAAMQCFARRGFRQTTMQDISHEAGISVGLIYRYFESKEQVIATIAAEHLAEVGRKLEEARQLPRLIDALEKVLRCDEHDPHLRASFVVNLFADAAHDAHVRELLAKVYAEVVEGVTSLVASSPEAEGLKPGLAPRDVAEIVFQSLHGLMLDEVLEPGTRTPQEILQRRTATLRRLWSLLFPALPPARGGRKD